MEDNTLTLIFDSDEEQNQMKDNEEEQEEVENSPIFKDIEDSKIEGEGGSSCVNRTTNNLITSNSF